MYENKDKNKNRDKSASPFFFGSKGGFGSKNGSNFKNAPGNKGAPGFKTGSKNEDGSKGESRFKGGVANKGVADKNSQGFKKPDSKPWAAKSENGSDESKHSFSRKNNFHNKKRRGFNKKTSENSANNTDSRKRIDSNNVATDSDANYNKRKPNRQKFGQKFGGNRNSDANPAKGFRNQQFMPKQSDFTKQGDTFKQSDATKQSDEFNKDYINAENFDATSGENIVTSPAFTDDTSDIVAEHNLAFLQQADDDGNDEIIGDYTIYGIKFDSNKYKVAYYSPCDGVECKQGDRVVAITNRGMEIGEVVNIRRSVKPFEQIVRKATEADDTNAHENRKKAKDAFDVCLKKIRQHNLSMKLTSAYYTLDREKLLFYFTADGRVDFRELVKTLASTFRTRIELRQIGVRDEAKMLGGIGVCGVPLCCSSFLHNFTSVSITMAKEQGLSLNPTKLSGVCGRLMCCLKYEQDSYSELLQKMPGYDAIVETPSGKGVVTGMSVLRGLVKVKLDNNNDGLFTFPIADIKIIKKGRIHFSENSEDIDSIELKLLEKEDSVSE